MLAQEVGHVRGERYRRDDRHAAPGDLDARDVRGSLAGGLARCINRVDPGINRGRERQQRRSGLPAANGRQVQPLEQIPKRLARPVRVGRQRVER
jgi:hypothetical protein